ncbi:putative PEP-binding protein [Lyngbya aestuarii]|uniref:putative PEP-binding protein n=1 Tax=Lyngbya aestuarii TaxID=118322 RepID=UPI00403DBB9B
MDNLYWLDQIQPTEYLCVGNKAFNLSQLLQRGYPVLPGLVVPGRALWEFLEILGESEPLLADFPQSNLHVDLDNPAQLQLVAQQIRHEMITTALPPQWEASILKGAELLQATNLILRPSLSLQVQIMGVTNFTFDTPRSIFEISHKARSLPMKMWESHISSQEPTVLTLSVKRVWAELFRARSLFYCQRSSVNLQQLNLAVLVQPIRNAIASGTLKADPDEWSIEATWGLGTAINRGEVLPDFYKIDPKTGSVYTRKLGSKTRAYCLRRRKEQESSSLAQSGVSQVQNLSLQVYLLGTEQQKQYALPEKYLKQLIELSERLSAEIDRTFSLEWTLCQTPESSIPQLYLTQFSLRSSKQLAINESENLRETEQNYQSTALQQVLQVESGRLYLPNQDAIIQQPSPFYQLESSQELTDEGLTAQDSPLSSNLNYAHYLPATTSAENEKVEGKPSSTRQPAIPSNLPSQGSLLNPQILRGLPAAAGRVTATAQVITGENHDLEAKIAGKILVTHSVAPDWLPLLKQAVGIVTEQGGMTSHAAIIARELGIPAVASAAGVTKVIQSGELLLVDGTQGEIHRLAAGKSSPASPSKLEVSPQPSHLQPYFPIATQLLVNISQPDSLSRIAGLPVDGVGLLRSELMMLNILENLHPNEWRRRGRDRELVERLAQLIIQFAAALAPRPVMYRSWDWRSHEFQSLVGDPSGNELEVNPIIGLRGTRSYVRDPTCFDLELAALRKVYSYGYTNIQLILPFVRTVEEFIFCRDRVEKVGLTENPQFQLWIMAEVPSVLFLLPDYVKAGVQGISIGTNDLTQLLLAADRDHERLGNQLDGRHPVVKQAIEQLIAVAKNTGIPCSICGQAPSQYPELINSLVDWGITSISVDINEIQSTYRAIARAEQRILLQAARHKIGG